MRSVLTYDAQHSAEWLGRPHRIVETTAELTAAVEAGELAVCADGVLVSSTSRADVLIEASNAVLGGARHADGRAEQGRHPRERESCQDQAEGEEGARRERPEPGV